VSFINAITHRRVVPLSTSSLPMTSSLHVAVATVSTAMTPDTITTTTATTDTATATTTTTTTTSTTATASNTTTTSPATATTFTTTFASGTVKSHTALRDFRGPFAHSKPTTQPPFARSVCRALQNLLFPSGEPPRWRLNLDVLVPALDNPATFDIASEGHTFNGNTLFLRGSKSPYVCEERDGPIIKRLFPRGEIRSLDTGHLVHSERPAEFVTEVLRFVGGDNR
jgi:pimeloyl-ACP methyl ester carboxylesterase